MRAPFEFVRSVLKMHPISNTEFFIFKLGKVTIENRNAISLRYYLKPQVRVDDVSIREIKNIMEAKRYMDMLPYLENDMGVAFPNFISLGFSIQRAIFVKMDGTYEFVMEDTVAQFKYDEAANANPEDDDYSVKVNEHFMAVISEATTKLIDRIRSNNVASTRLAQATARLNESRSLAQMTGEVTSYSADLEKFKESVDRTENNIAICFKKLIMAARLSERDTAKIDEVTGAPKLKRDDDLDSLYVSYLRTLIDEYSAFEIASVLLDEEKELYKRFNLDMNSEVESDDDEDEDDSADDDNSDGDEDENSDDDDSEDDSDESEDDSDEDADADADEDEEEDE